MYVCFCCTVCHSMCLSGCGITLRKSRSHPLGDWLCGHKSHWHTCNSQTQVYIGCQAQCGVVLGLVVPSSHDFWSELSIQSYTPPLRKQLTGRCWTSCGGLDSKDVQFINYLIWFIWGSAASLDSIQWRDISWWYIAFSVEPPVVIIILHHQHCIFSHPLFVSISLLSGQILHTDVVYLHNSDQRKEADKLRHLMMKYRYCCLCLKGHFELYLSVFLLLLLSSLHLCSSNDNSVLQNHLRERELWTESSLPNLAS